MKPHKKSLTSTYNLKNLAPQIAKQWHPTKNAGMSPEQVTPGSGKKVWWLCEEGHEWEASPHQRRKNARCPICVNRRVSFSNNLAIQDPRLAAEWHPTKNRTLTPDRVVPGSGKTVWWRCEQGHEWKARIVDRSNGRRCDKCIGHQAHAAHNLAISFPGLAKEWHPDKNGQLTPYMVTPRSSKKVWWHCSRGHKWESTVSNRAKGQNCPECKPNTSLQEIRLFCELKTLFNEVLWRTRLDGVECDILVPKYKAAVEYDGAYWHVTRTKQDLVKNKKLVKMGIQLFRLRGHGLSKLSDTDIVLPPRQTNDPDINVVKTLLRMMRKILTLDRQDTNRVSAYLLLKQFANPKEFRRIVSRLPGPPIEKSLATESPGLVKEWHVGKNAPLTAEMFYPGSGKVVWWICEKGHEWKAKIAHRVSGVGCPYCAGQRALPENNLAVKFPQIAEEWHPMRNGYLTPWLVTPKSNKIVWWICQRGHEWKSSVHNRSSGTGCPYCRGKKVCADNSLAARLPELAKQWHPTKNGDIRPDSIIPGSHRKVWWRCAKGHEWEAQLKSRAIGVGCPFCAGKKATAEHNLAESFPNLTREWHPTKNGDLKPSDVLPQSSKKVWWICKKGHEWKTSIAGRTGGSGCPSCSGTRVTKYNNLAKLFPAIAKQWHPTKNGNLGPEHVKGGSDKKVWWQCSRGHEWQRRVQYEVKNDRCPICKTKSLEGISQHPRILIGVSN